MVLRQTRQVASLIEAYFRSHKPSLHSRIFKLHSVLAGLSPKELKESTPSVPKQHIHSSEPRQHQLLQLEKTLKSRQGLGLVPLAWRKNQGCSMWEQAGETPVRGWSWTSFPKWVSSHGRWQGTQLEALCCLPVGTGKALQVAEKEPFSSTTQAGTGAFPDEGTESPLQAQPQLLEQLISLPTFTAVSTSGWTGLLAPRAPGGSGNPALFRRQGPRKSSDHGFLGKETWGKGGEMTYPSPRSTCSSLTGGRHVAALQCGLRNANAKAAESPPDSVNTSCRCGLREKPCVAAERCASKLGKLQQSSGQKMSRLTHQTACLKVGEIQVKPFAQ